MYLCLSWVPYYFDCIVQSLNLQALYIWTQFGDVESEAQDGGAAIGNRSLRITHQKLSAQNHLHTPSRFFVAV